MTAFYMMIQIKKIEKNITFCSDSDGRISMTAYLLKPTKKWKQEMVV